LKTPCTGWKKSRFNQGQSPLRL